MVDLEGTYTLNAPRDVVWEALMDPQVMADILPGCEKMDLVEPDFYRALIKIKVGPVQGNFEGTVRLSDVQEPDSYHMDVTGKGAPGFVNGEANIRLEPQGNDDTLLSYKGTASVGGKLAGVGQRLLESSAKFIVQQGLDALNRRIQSRAAAQGGNGGGSG